MINSLWLYKALLDVLTRGLKPGLSSGCIITKLFRYIFLTANVLCEILTDFYPSISIKSSFTRTIHSFGLTIILLKKDIYT